MIQGSFLRIGTKFKLYCKERGIDEGANPLIYVIKKYEYRSSLRKLIRKLHIFLLIKTFVKKLKVLVAFLSNQKLEGN